MGRSLFEKLLDTHFAGGAREAGGDALVRVDQTFVGEASASLAFLALEQFGVDRVRAPLAVCYLDQGAPAEDGRIADEHAYVLAAARRMGVLFSPPAHGVATALHLDRFAKPGQCVVAAHENASALGAAGMLALSCSALDAALVLAGEPYAFSVPRVWRLRVTGSLPAWVGGADIALELVRRHGLTARAGTVLELAGEGLASLPVTERALIATMTSALGVVTTLFPSDDTLARHLSACGREGDFVALAADEDATYAFDDELDLSALEPLIAKPQSPHNVVPVRFAEGTPIGQAVVGGATFANARDLVRVTAMLRERAVYSGVSFDFNPPTRASIVTLAETGALATLLDAGVRVHEPGLGGTSGIGQAPQGGKPSLRTAMQNFPGASGTRDDRVFLCSAATATISAVRGVITRPSEAGVDPLAAGEDVTLRHVTKSARAGFVEPLPPPPDPEPGPSKQRVSVPPPIPKGASVKALPPLDLFPKRGELRVALKLPDDVPLHEIVPEGLRGFAYGSNVVALADLAFERIDLTYVKRAKVAREQGGHVLVAGQNFGYGSRRDQTALALRNLGLRVVVAKSYGGAFRRSLVNAGILPLTFVDAGDYYPIEPGELLVFEDLRSALATDPDLAVRRKAQSSFLTKTSLRPRELAILLAGGLPNWFQKTVASSSPPASVR